MNQQGRQRCQRGAVHLRSSSGISNFSNEQIHRMKHPSQNKDMARTTGATANDAAMLLGTGDGSGYPTSSSPTRRRPITRSKGTPPIRLGTEAAQTQYQRAAKEPHGQQPGGPVVIEQSEHDGPPHCGSQAPPGVGGLSRRHRDSHAFQPLLARTATPKRPALNTENFFKEVRGRSRRQSEPDQLLRLVLEQPKMAEVKVLCLPKGRQHRPWHRAPRRGIATAEQHCFPLPQRQGTPTHGLAAQQHPHQTTPAPDIDHVWRPPRTRCATRAVIDGRSCDSGKHMHDPPRRPPFWPPGMLSRSRPQGCHGTPPQSTSPTPRPRQTPASARVHGGPTRERYPGATMGSSPAARRHPPGMAVEPSAGSPWPHGSWPRRTASTRYRQLPKAVPLGRSFWPCVADREQQLNPRSSIPARPRAHEVTSPNQGRLAQLIKRTNRRHGGASWVPNICGAQQPTERPPLPRLAPRPPPSHFVTPEQRQRLCATSLKARPGPSRLAPGQQIAAGAPPQHSCTTPWPCRNQSTGSRSSANTHGTIGLGGQHALRPPCSYRVSLNHDPRPPPRAKYGALGSQRQLSPRPRVMGLSANTATNPFFRRKLRPNGCNATVDSSEMATRPKGSGTIYKSDDRTRHRSMEQSPKQLVRSVPSKPTSCSLKQHKPSERGPSRSAPPKTKSIWVKTKSILGAGSTRTRATATHRPRPPARSSTIPPPWPCRMAATTLAPHTGARHGPPRPIYRRPILSTGAYLPDRSIKQVPLALRQSSPHLRARPPGQDGAGTFPPNRKHISFRHHCRKGPRISFARATLPQTTSGQPSFHCAHQNEAKPVNRKHTRRFLIR